MAFKHLHEHIFKALDATYFVDIAVGYQLAALYDSYLVAEFLGYIQNVGREKDGTPLVTHFAEYLL